MQVRGIRTNGRRRWIGLLLLAAGILLAPGPILRAQVPPGPEADPTEGPWSVDDVLLAESADQFRISPDGSHVVWVRSRMSADEGRRVSNLWISRLEDGESWPLTRGTDRDYGPRWSPNGEMVVFQSSRSTEEGDEEGDEGQLWALRLDGGEPWPLTTGVRDLRAYAFRGGSSDTLILAAREQRSRYEEGLEDAGDDTRAVEDTLTELPVRLWALDVESGETSRITVNRHWIEDLAVSPDGQTAVVRAGRDLSYAYDGKRPPRTWIVDLSTGERTEILPVDSIVPRDLDWARDGRGVYFSYRVSSHPRYETASVGRVGFWNRRTGEMRRVDLGWSRGLAGGLEVVPGGFLALLADGVRFRPALYRNSEDGWTRVLLSGEHVPQIFEWSASKGGDRVAYVTSSGDRPTQPYAARLRDRTLVDPIQLDELNPEFAEKPKPRAEVVRWVGARGDSVEGLLYYPLDWREGRRYPLVVSPHGGPASVDLDAWSQSWADPTVLYNQRGAFVFKPNYHGSANYGLEWVESIGGGNYYELEVPDIQRGVDRLIERGLVHPDSVAAQGWSNGAILTTALVVEDPERYRAAAVGAGNVEWTTDWGTIAFGATFDNYYMGGSPFDIPEVYREKSPFFDLDRVETPTLIFHGTEDRAVYTSQGWMHYRALQQRTDTPVRFLLFPGEPHGLGELAHQRRKVKEELRWMDAYLWGRESEPARLALDPESPLARALERAEAGRVEGRFGVHRSGILVPETVPYGGIRIGRFEVTRAQWAEFDADYAYPAGTGDHPVNGVSLERARAYARWLGERTGGSWRLPTDEELEPLARAASSGNTLDRWAGYAPNPEDADRLRRLAGELSGEAPLLRAVGQFRPHEVTTSNGRSAALVYGLGGNVSEWATTGDGGGRPVGRSANRPAGEPESISEVGAAYTGLRVVREP